jgi:tetratricopeptide (TPR) repeat protein
MLTQRNASSCGRESEQEFLRGTRHMRDGDWAAALVHFSQAVRIAGHRDPMTNTYLSYEGLALIHLNERRGLLLCRRAAARELLRGDVFRNLARAELRLGNRRRACEVIKRGLAVDARHAGLRDLRRRMGVRRAPAIAFLSRDHFLNRCIGRLTYRPGRARAGR